MAEEEVILKAEGLTKEFKGFVAVKNVDLSVRRHTIHALIGPNGAGKTTLLQPAHALPDADGGPDPLQGPQHHRQLACGDRAHGAGALVPDLGGLPASFGARECPCRSAAQARQLLPFLAQRARAEPARRPRHGAGDGRRPRGLRRAAGRRPALWPQAGAGDRHHPGARSRDDAARRADGGPGAGGHQAHRRADPHRRPRPHRADGRAQHVRRRRSLRHHHRAGARRGAGRGPLRDGVQESAVVEAYVGTGHG